MTNAIIKAPPKELEFAVFCIENVACRRQEFPEKTYQLLHKSGLLEQYILPAYAALHTQSKEYIVNDIIQRMSEKKL